MSIQAKKMKTPQNVKNKTKRIIPNASHQEMILNPDGVDVYTS